MVKIIDKTIDDVKVCTIEGKLSGFEGKGLIQEKIRELIKENVLNIVLDLSKVNWIDSTGLGELIASLSSLKKKNGNLFLASLQDPVQSLLKMTNLDQIFETFDSVEAAVVKVKG